jgi:hypothetical protein
MLLLLQVVLRRLLYSDGLLGLPSYTGGPLKDPGNHMSPVTAAAAAARLLLVLLLLLLQVVLSRLLYSEALLGLPLY